uniref:Uncharacterized protein n=1 Tax=Anopheles atroparvus TaxID=41427 RepID=A0A182IMY9_ANOAO
MRSCYGLFICVNKLRNLPEREALRQTLSGVKELSLAYIQIFNDAILHKLLAIMPSLNSLRFVGLNISFHSGPYKKLSTGAQIQPSNGRLTFLYIFQICSELPRLRVLILRRCLAIGNQGVRQVAQLAQLQVLDVSYCYGINGEGILEGITSSKNDNRRELHICELALSERCIIAITENLPELRLLDLSRCFRDILDLCLQYICRNLVRLKKLFLDDYMKVFEGG